MKQLLSLFLFLLPCLAWAQYPSNGNQKITLGEQTTADGLIWRGVASDTTLTAKSDTAAYFVLDTVNINLYTYKASATGKKWIQLGSDTTSLNLVSRFAAKLNISDTASMLTNYWRSGRFSGVLPLLNGGTGSATQNFVDLTNTQSIGGAKTFTSAVTATRFNPTANTVTGTGIYLPAANTLGFSTNGQQRMTLDASDNLGLGVTPRAWLDALTSLDIKGGVSIMGFNNESYYMNNIYYDTGYKYKANGFAGMYLQNSAGQHKFYTSLSGTADGVVSLIDAITLKVDNELQIAGTTDRGAYNLQVNGTGVWGEGAYANGSDANIKENIIYLDSSLNIVNNLKPVVFNYINASVNNDTKHLGFIAQDVYQTLENKDYLGSIVRSDGDTLSIAYSNIIPLLTKAIQEQQALIKALEQRIINLENK
jgi:hypothetical protein